MKLQNSPISRCTQEVSSYSSFIGGDPFLRFWNKKGMILDEMTVARYDKEELNKILKGFGLKYVEGLTWEEREKASKFLNPAAFGNNSGGEEQEKKEDL